MCSPVGIHLRHAFAEASSDAANILAGIGELANPGLPLLGAGRCCLLQHLVPERTTTRKMSESFLVMGFRHIVHKNHHRFYHIIYKWTAPPYHIHMHSPGLLASQRNLHKCTLRMLLSLQMLILHIRSTREELMAFDTGPLHKRPE